MAKWKSWMPLLVAAWFIGGCGAVQGQQADVYTAFVGVNVIPMDRDEVLENQTVLVQNDRIARVGPVDEVDLPETAQRIDGAGRYLIPGLAEMHGHIPSMNASPDYIESVLFLFVANGITTVRGMQGAEGQLALRERAHKGEIVSPTLYLAGPGFSGGSIDSPEQAAARVRAQAAEGWDLIKVLPGLTRDEYDAMARTANEVGIRFAGHVPSAVGLLHAIDMGQDSFDHLDGYIEYLDGAARPVDDARLAEVARRTRDTGVWVVPTMALWEVLQGTLDLETVQGYEELAYMPPAEVARWIDAHRTRLAGPNFDPERARTVVANRMRLLRALNDGGARILMGTDAPQQFSVPGFSLHRELQRMADAGMTPYQILRSGSYAVGEYFADEDRFGVVAPGHRADLVLLDRNPLENITHVARPSGVMVRGRWLAREAIEARLQEIAARYVQ